MKNFFSFTLKSLFVLKILKFLSWCYGHIAKQLEWTDQFIFQMTYFLAWDKISSNTHVACCSISQEVKTIKQTI